MQKLSIRKRIEKCRLCSDRDETVDHIINECSKIVLTSYDWVGKVIHWELCKWLKFGHANNFFTHKPESVHENVTHKIFWDFEIQTDHQILTRRQDLLLINKKKSSLAIKKYTNLSLSDSQFFTFDITVLKPKN